MKQCITIEVEEVALCRQTDSLLFQRFNPELGEFFQLLQLDSHVRGTVTLTDRCPKTDSYSVYCPPPPP